MITSLLPVFNLFLCLILVMTCKISEFQKLHLLWVYKPYNICRITLVTDYALFWSRSRYANEIWYSKEKKRYATDISQTKNNYWCPHSICDKKSLLLVFITLIHQQLSNNNNLRTKAANCNYFMFTSPSFFNYAVAQWQKNLIDVFKTKLSLKIFNKWVK